MAIYSTPGVYFEWQDAQRGIEPARTDIAAFVGIAERGPVHRPVRVESWTQFTTLFGGPIPQAYLAYAVQGFFANGGLICYVVRVVNPDWARRAVLDVVDPTGTTRMRLTASSEGAWANNLVLSFLRQGEARFNLTLSLPGGQEEIWRDLTLADEYDPRHAVRVLSPTRAAALYDDQAPSPIDPAVPGSFLVEACLLRVKDPPAEVVLNMSNLLTFGRMKGGADGWWMLQPEHFNGVLAADGQNWGLAALDDTSQVAMVAIPDLIPPRESPLPPRPLPTDCRILDAPPGLPSPLPGADPDLPPVFTAQQIRALEDSLVNHCERHQDRIALLQLGQEEIDPQAVVARRNDFDSSYAALYFPWLRVPDPLGLSGLLRAVPPCGHMAGICARVENERGPHKPPANELIEYAQDVTVKVDDRVHGYLNEHSVNVLKAGGARGLRPMGARTLSSDPIWRYLNVRRLLLNIERAILASTQWLTFEPNQVDLWRDVERVLRVYLDGLWKRGMLDGDSADAAYTVDCSPRTNPPDVTDLGQMIAVIGVQPPIPAEFVIVRIGRVDSGLKFIE